MTAAAPIISKQEAQALGLKRYFTGKPCKHGHVAERIVANKTCVECYKAIRSRHYEKNAEAVLESQLRYREANREKIREGHRRYYQANKEKHLERSREWRKLTPEKNREYKRKWKKSNPSKIAAICSASRARKIQATPSWAEPKLITAWYELARVMNETSGGERYEVDHIVPLRGKTVCGLHTEGNLQILPARQNNSKGNKWPLSAQADGAIA